MIRYSKKTTVTDDPDNWSRSDWLNPDNTVADFAYNFTASDGKNTLYGRLKPVTQIADPTITEYGIKKLQFTTNNANTEIESFIIEAGDEETVYGLTKTANTERQKHLRIY